jgi:putative membrane protein
VKAAVGAGTDGLFLVMEGRLIRVIMRPAAVVALLAGVLLVFEGQFELTSPWLLAKLLGVVLLIAYHGMLERYGRLFANGWRGRSERYFRAINEIPTVLLIWIVIWVVVKPFS